MLAADDESASTKIGATRARHSHGGKTLFSIFISCCFLTMDVYNR